MDKINIYCERTSPELLSEPINLITNLAFIIAGLFLYRLTYKQDHLSLSTHLQLIMIIVIGVGSGLFHSFATRWAMFMDVIPILLYQIIYLFSYSRNIIRLNWGYTTGLFVLYILITYGFGQLPRELLNGSLSYAPALIFSFGFGVYHKLLRQKFEWGLLVASVIFIISLSFRVIDEQICDVFPLGTHFMWHSLNAVVLGLSSYSYFINQKR